MAAAGDRAGGGTAGNSAETAGVGAAGDGVETAGVGEPAGFSWLNELTGAFSRGWR